MDVAKKRKKRKLSEPARPLLVKLRTEAGLTQEQLAKKLGVDETSVSHWEQGSSFPKRSRLPDVAAALGVSIADLLGAA